MKKYSIYLLFMGVLFMQCSKKTTDSMVDKGTEVVKDAPVDIAWRSGAPTPGEARAIQLGKANSFDLSNGLKVIVVENHKIPRVSYQLSLNNDQILEKDQVGFVSVAGSLMGTGTKTKSKADIDAAVDFIGASLNTSGSGVFASGLKKHSQKLLEVMTDVLYNPSFPEEEFKKIKTQTLSGLSQTASNADAMAGNVAGVLNYGVNHPYGEIQTEDDVNNMTIESIKSYYNTYFKPNNAFLIIVGDVTPAEAKADAEKYFASWKRGEMPATNYSAPEEVKGANVAFANKDGAVQSVIRITYPINLKPGADDQIKSSVMNSILGGGVFSGRLMQNLREDKAYTYSSRSSLSANSLVGNFNAGASVRNAVTDSSIHEILFEMDRLRTEPVSVDDLQLVKNSMAGGFARSLESPQTIARFARNIYKFNLPADYYETYLQKLDAVSIVDVQAMAQKYIRPENANIVVAGSKDEVAANLAKFDVDGVVDFYDAFGKKLDIQEAAMPAGLDAKTIVSDYLDAIGGLDKINTIKSIVSKFSADLMGQTASMETGQKENKMFYLEMSMAGNMMMEQRFDGTQGSMGGMGQSQVVTEGPEFDAMKEQAILFGQLAYLDATSPYKIDLKGIEDVNGEKAYKLQITKASGDKAYEFYSVKSNLLIRSMSTQDGPGGQPQTITNEYADFKDVNGIKFPHSITTIGAMPFPLVMKADSFSINGEIPAAKFKTN
ncbi:MAG: zinc protease [Saprospiraceae bacterium]|jgi:predicted Zn-dependent peptidase